MKGKAYISSKMTGCADMNYPRFDEIAEGLRIMDYHVINPADIGRVLEAEGKPVSYREYMAFDLLTMINEADMLVLFDDWYTSDGAMLELHTAMKLGMDIRVYPSMRPLMWDDLSVIVPALGRSVSGAMLERGVIKESSSS